MCLIDVNDNWKDFSLIKVDDEIEIIYFLESFDSWKNEWYVVVFFKNLLIIFRNSTLSITHLEEKN